MSLLFSSKNRTATLRSGNQPWLTPFTAHRQILAAKVQILFVNRLLIVKKMAKK
jgi:hypothetical protein